MHRLVLDYDNEQDEELLKLLRFHSSFEQQQDVKLSRIMRRSASRIEELKGQLRDAIRPNRT